MKRLLLSLVPLMLAPSTTTEAQADDKAYCAELSALYRRYVQPAAGRRFDAEAAVALEDCQKDTSV